MPLPSPLVGATVRAKRIAADGSAVVGAVITLTPTVPAQSPAGDVVVSTAALPKTTDANGVAEWTEVLLTDSPGLSNRVPYAVTVVESGKLIDSYVVELLSAQVVGGVIRLDDVARATPPQPLASYILAAVIGAVGGVAGPLDANGQVPASQLPAAGGSIPATIVDAKGDLVTATAPDAPARLAVGADGRVLMADASQSTGLRWVALSFADIANLQTTLDGKVDESVLDAKGDLYVATAADTPGRLAVGSDGQLLVTDSGQATGLKWQDLARPAYPLAGDGLIAATAAPDCFRDNTFALGAVWRVRVFVPAGKAITNCVTAIHTAGVVGAGGTNSFAIYTDAGVLVSQTVSDNNLWTAAGPLTKALPSPIAAQSADRYVYLGIMVNGYTTNPTFNFINGSSSAGMFAGGFGSGKRRVVINAGSSSSWDASFNPATDGATSGFLPFLALS